MSPPAEPVLDPDQILLGINNGAGIYIAPVGTPGPADLVTEWASPWESLGYLSDDGPTVSSSTDSDTLTPWQSTSPVRTVITGKTLTMHFILWQTDPQSVALYFDMPAPTAATDGSFAFDISSSGGGVMYAVGLDIKDGDTVMRITFSRAQLTDTGDVQFQRGAAIGWEVTLSALDNNGVLGHVQAGPATAAPGALATETEQSTEAA